MRFEFFHYDPDGFDTFEWYKTVDMEPSMGSDTLPCNMRMTHGSKFDPSHDGRSIVPDLAGPVAVLDNTCVPAPPFCLPDAAGGRRAALRRS